MILEFYVFKCRFILVILIKFCVYIIKYSNIVVSEIIVSNCGLGFFLRFLVFDNEYLFVYFVGFIFCRILL